MFRNRPSRISPRNRPTRSMQAMLVGRLTFLQPTVTHTPTTNHTVDAGNVSWAFDVPEPTVTHTPVPSFAEVTVDIGSALVTATLLVWSQDADLGTTFDADGLGQTLTQTVIYYSGGIAGTVNLSIDGNNNRFTRAFEQTGRIIFEATSTGETLEVMIADADTEEPYSWIPSNSAEVLAFATHVLSLSDRSATVTLRIGDPPATNHTVDAGDVVWTFDVPQVTVTHTPAANHAVDAGGVSWAFEVVEPTVTRTSPQQAHAVDAGDVSWTFSFTEPTVTHTLAPLTLADFDTTGFAG